MSPESLTVCVVGLGYIGLPTAALIASKGIRVFGVDSNPAVVATVGTGRVHISEADLDGLVQKVVTSGRLAPHDRPQRAGVFLIAVPTPISPNKRPVVDHVLSAARSIAPVLSSGCLVIIESTCPIGTTEQVGAMLAELRPDLRFPDPDNANDEPDVSIAYCPERVLPGRILIELEQNDRCIGGLTPHCAAKARRFYELFVRGSCFETGARTAEMIKLTENAYRDTNIAFANELSLICDHIGVDVWEVIELANRHPRVKILQPGPGVGGHCIAVDPWFIVDAAPQEARLIRLSREVNDGKADYVFRHTSALIEANPDRSVACLGLTFKANIDDLRESPALEIVERLAGSFGGRINVVEPHIDMLPKTLSEAGVSKIALDHALSTAGILILLVDHEPFRRVSLQMRNGAIVYDTRGNLAGMTPESISVRASERRAGEAFRDFSETSADSALPDSYVTPLSTQTIVRWHKLSRRLLSLRLERMSRMIEHLIRVVYTARIPAEADIDSSVHFSHNALAVVITKKARIGPRCQIGMHVVLGSRWPLKGGPILEEDVIVHTGAKVIGPVVVGRGSVIGANAVVLEDVPACSLVVGVPAVVKKTSIRIESYRVPPGTFD